MTWVVERADRTPRSTTMNANIPTVENQIDIIKIAIDMHLKSYRVVRQLDFSAPQPAQRFEPLKFYPCPKPLIYLGRVWKFDLARFEAVKLGISREPSI